MLAFPNSEMRLLNFVKPFKGRLKCGSLINLRNVASLSEEMNTSPFLETPENFSGSIPKTILFAQYSSRDTLFLPILKANF